MKHDPYLRIRPNANIAILMIHGILGTPRHFDFLLSQIPDEYEVRAILLPGHGGTVADFSNADHAEWLKHAESCLQQMLSPQRKIIVVGHSLGALLALQLSQKYDRVTSLMLLNPPLSPRVHPRMWFRNIRFAFDRIDLNDPLDLALYTASGTQLEKNLFKYIPWIPNFVALLRLCRQCRDIPKKLCVPCVAFLGEEDDLVHIRAKKWFQDIPNISVTIFPDGGHFTYTPRQQQQIRDALTELIKQHE